MKTKTFKYAIGFTLLFMLLALLLSTKAEEKIAEADISANLTAEETATIATQGSTDYIIIYAGADNSYADNDMAAELRARFNNIYGVTVPSRMDVNAANISKHEILLGDTDRRLSSDLKTYIEIAAPKDKYVAWGYIYKDGKLAYNANSQEGFIHGKNMLFDLMSAGGFTVKSGEYVVVKITLEQYAEEIKAIEEAEKQAARQEKLDKINAMQNAFTDAQFGVDQYRPMIGENGHYTESPYDAPWVYPTDGEHPRLLLNASDVETIKEILADPQYAEFAELFWSLADGDCEYGILPDQYINGKVYRWKNGYLHIMVAKAMAYLITGDELYAKEAIVSIKNTMLTYLMIEEIDSDTYAGGSNVMYTLAMVYDWCYDQLTEADKRQIVAGVPYLCLSTMEIPYPPEKWSYVVGHGTGPQFLRDMMFVTTAFYDEAPDWWEFVAGKYFQCYFPVADLTFGQGWVSQGTANYAYHKLEVQLWSALCIYTSCGEIFFDEKINDGGYFLISHAMTGTGNFFSTGDGVRSQVGATRSWEYGQYALLSALFKDSTMFAYTKAKSNNFTVYQAGSITLPSPAQLLAIMALYLREGEDTGEGQYDNIPLIQFFDDPAGQMTVRDSWTEDDAAAVLMKIGTLTMGNHDALDAGTFQIYYKGLLTCNSGTYKKYGGNTHRYYLQATISHNGLLVFNPSLAADEPLYEGEKMKNAASYYYSGGQVAKKDPSTIDPFLNGEMTTAELTGASFGYFTDGSAEYGYIAGDLSKSYDPQTVDYIERRMLTVFTGDKEFPMLFLTYDSITAVNENFTKTFLLHTVTKPTAFNTDSLTATVVNGEGKMHIASIFGGDEIEMIGGPGKAFWINGKNCVDEYNDDDSADKIWGRIEIRASGEKTTNMLTAMYVTDADNTNTLETEKYENDKVQAIKVKNIIAAFCKSAEKLYKEFDFAVDGKGLYRYYLSGIAAGTWAVKVDGVTVAHVYSDDGEGLVSFVAPTGEITLVPGGDVMGTNGGKIQYVLNGGILPDGTRYVYNSETETALPTEVYKENGTFKGWYTSPDFEPETFITHIPEGTSGTFKVYAKWYNVYFNEDYTNAKINATEKTSDNVNGINYGSQNKPGASFESKVDENGVPYVLWVKGSKDPSVSVGSSNGAIDLVAADDKCLSYEIKLARDGDNALIPTTVQLIAAKNVDGAELSPTLKVKLLTIYEDGSVYLGNTLVALLESDSVTTIRFVMDFENLEIRVHNESYKHLATGAISIPKGTDATTGAELMKCLNKYMLHFYASSSSENTNNAMRIYGIRIEDSDVITPKIPVFEKPIIYNLAGGSLPLNAPDEFSETEVTPLPTPIKANSEFLGWYTTPDFMPSSKITEIPATEGEEFKVYARWYTTILEEDYTGFDEGVIVQGDSVNKNGINYSASDKDNASFTVKTDEGGTKYLEWNNDKRDPAIHLKGTNINMTNTTATAMTYIFKLSADGDNPFPNLQFTLYLKKNANGDTIKTEQITALNISSSKILLGGKTEIGTVTSELTTIRLVVDFEALEFRAYSANGVLLATNSFPMPQSSGATNGAELIRCFPDRLMNIRVTSSEEARTMRFYGFEVIEGDAFANIEANAINYVTNAGTLPTEYPEYFSRTEATMLPIPEKEGFDFAGWYTTPNFADGTLVTEIPSDEESEYVMVYAKWKNKPIINYVLDGGTLPSGAPQMYSKEENTVLPIPAKDGYIFKGWYTEGGTLITEIPHDTDKAPFTVLARWEIERKIIYEFDGGTVSGEYNMQYSNSDAVELPTPERALSEFLGWYTDPSFAEEFLLSDGTFPATAGIEPIKIYARWKYVRKINYELDGGTLPEGYPEQFSREEATPLPIPTKPNSEFLGWYTTPSFKSSSKITEIPANSEGDEVTVYAKWYTVVVDEDFSGFEDGTVIAQGTNVSQNGIAYTADAKQNASFIVKTDANGVKYLEWNNDTKDPAIHLKGEAITMSNTAATALSFTVMLSADGDNPFPNMEFSLYAKRDINGNALSKTQQIYALRIIDSKILLAGKTEIGKVTSALTVIRLVVDFAALEFRAYGENGTLLATEAIPVPESTGATSGEGFVKCFYDRLLNIRFHSSDTAKTMRFYGFKVTEGDEFKVVVENAIDYVLGGGTFNTEYPIQYSKEEDIALPTPIKDKSVFAGWYTTPTFDDGTLIAKVPKETIADPFTVYARWYNVLIDEDYSTTKLELNEASKTINGITYSYDNKEGVSYKTVEGENYLVWTKGTKDPAIDLVGNGINLTNSQAGVITFTIELSKDGASAFPDLDAKFVAGRDVNGNKLNPTSKIQTFIVKDNVAYLGASASADKKLCEITDKVTKIQFVADFDNLELRAYNTSGELITLKFAIPDNTGAENGRELMTCCYTRILNIRLATSGGENRSARIYGIRVAEGDELAS